MKVIIFHLLQIWKNLIVHLLQIQQAGLYFFLTYNKEYILKSLDNTKEKDTLRRILYPYFQHIMSQPWTFLTKFFGLYRVSRIQPKQDIYYIIMHNIWRTSQLINLRFDLKGSQFLRNVSPEEIKRKNSVLKDVEFNEKGIKLKLGKRRDEFMKILEADTKFLENHDIMDYSMLLGVHTRKKYK